MSALYRINHLERLPLKTPYPAQIERIKLVMSRMPRQTDLVCDFGGVGRGIFDMLVDAGLSPTGVAIYGGFETHHAGSIVSVPKSTLVSTLVARIHAQELRAPASLKEWPQLRRELMNFRPEVTRAGTETWNARSGEHDDLVLAVALAVWHLAGGSSKYSGLISWYQREVGGADAERWALGVDLGQAYDYTALAVLSLSEQAEQDVPAPLQILHAQPYAAFIAASGRRYTADERGRLQVSDLDDMRDLERAGARP
jgi:hypothetical protein